MKSIRLKLILMYIALVFIVIISCGTFTIMRIRIDEDNRFEQELSDAANKIADTVIKAHDESDFHAALLDNMRLAGSGTNRIECNIIDLSGRTIATNVADIGDVMPVYETSVVVAALMDISGESQFSSGRKYPNYQGFFRPWVEYARLASGDGERSAYVLYLRIDATGMLSAIAKTTNTLAMGLIIAMSVSVVLGIIFANSLNEPIAILTRTAKELARGNLNQVITVASKDEIGQLTQSFNDMARELNESISEIESEKNKLEIVLHNMTDGVLAYDNKGRLIHGNQVCRDMLGFWDIERLTLDEMLIKLGVISADKGESLPGDEPYSVKDVMLSINNKYINASCNAYKGNKGDNEGVIIILQDLTKRITLDNMRKEFVANVSHELRTPLTTIKSYAETLIDESDGSDAVQLGFLSTIDDEADRMTRLVNDLLELSRLDSKQIELNLQVVNLAELVGHTVKNHRHTISKENLGHSILYEAPTVEMLVLIDPDRIKQVLSNIITNSLRYSEGNVVIQVALRDDCQFYQITIKDNGMGIPEDDLSRIFERFYRVDKARSRTLGGTGLGLSISKEIVELHGGRISAESTLGAGTAMEIRLPHYEPDNENN